MTSKHNRNKIRTKKTHSYQQHQTSAQVENADEKSKINEDSEINEDSKINEDSETSDTIQNIDWHEVIQKTTGDADSTSEE